VDGVCVPPPGVFFSEYVEGTSLNKYLEIYNGSSITIDLFEYEIRLYPKDTSSPASCISLPHHMLAPGMVYVVGHPAGTLYVPDQEDSSLTFVGIDALELVDPSLSQVDVIGIIGSAYNFGEDLTLVRKAWILSGTTVFDIGEWNQLPLDTHQLGSHTP
jgi:hypothetical protein